MQVSEGDCFVCDVEFSLYESRGFDGDILSEKWVVVVQDDSDKTGDGKCFINIIEIAPSKTGQPICVYERHYITPDDEPLSQIRRKKIARLPSVKSLISRRNFKRCNDNSTLGIET